MREYNKLSRAPYTYLLFPQGLSWLFGHLASGFLSNPVAELIGRRRSLALDAAVFAAGFFVYAAGESVAALCIGRVLLGYPLVSTVMTPMQ